MGHGVSTSDKVLLVFGSLLVDNLQDPRLELSDIWNVVGSDTVLSLNSRNVDAEHRGTIVDGFVGHTEVESDGLGNFRRESPGSD